MVDLLIKNGVILQMDSQRTVIEDGAVAIEGQRIRDVGPTVAVTQQYDGSTVLDASGKAVIPGLITTHAHVSDILLRGGPADGRDGFDWLYNVKAPGVAVMDAGDNRVAAQLYCTEAIQAGITTFVESGAGAGSGFSEEVIRAKLDVYDTLGIRNIFGHSFIDQEPNKEMQDLVKTEQAKAPCVRHVHPQDVIVETEDALDSIAKLMEQYHRTAEGRQRVWPAPTFPHGTSPEGLRGAHDLAEEYDTMTTTHVGQSPHECGPHQSPIEYLHSEDYLDERALLAHCVFVSDRDIRLLATTDAAVAHNPLTNLKLGVGIASIPAMRTAGIPVALGTDNTSASDTINLFHDLRTTGVIHKGYHQDGSLLPAEELLAMATIDAARAMGMADEIGSIEPGKYADITLIDLEYPHLVPRSNPASTIVYQTQGFEVDTVLCNGEVILQDGQLPGLPVPIPELLEHARETAVSVRDRANITPTDNRCH